MHSVESYLRRQSTERLELILRRDIEGIEECPLDILLLVCQILAERNPPPPKSAKEMYQQFLQFYCPEIKDL